MPVSTHTLELVGVYHLGCQINLGTTEDLESFLTHNLFSFPGQSKAGEMIWNLLAMCLCIFLEEGNFTFSFWHLSVAS